MGSRQAPWFVGVMALLMVLLSALGLQSDGQEAAQPEASVTQKAMTAAQGTEKEKEKDKPVDPPKPAYDPISLYSEFFGSEAIRSTEYELGSMIALVPDPRDSHLSYRFDEAVEAIQEAYAEKGFLSDRLWNPWEIRPDKPAERLYRQHPGVLLFRRSGRSPRLEAVFLVGESPKTGIQKDAFFSAVEFAHALQGMPREKAATPENPQDDQDLSEVFKLREPVRILGPTFSGSMESLRLCLQRYLPDEKAPQPPPVAEAVEKLTGVKGVWFLVISGSATAMGLETFFKDDFGQRVWFGRTVVSDDVVQERAFQVLEPLGWDPERSALLVEADTTYGQRFQQSASKQFLVLRFPSQLARVRTAREQGGLGKEDEDENGESFLSESARKTLQLSLANSEKPVDIVPAFSPLTTTADDLALATLLESIAREKVRHVGIVATDIQDKLFLAKQLRTFSPNVVLFSFDSHLLDTHPQFAAAMDGMAVLSSHPLTVEGKDRGRFRRQFTSDFQRGVFEAATQLLAPGGRNLLDQDIWISVVSNGIVWPLSRQSPRMQGPEIGRPLEAGQELNEIKWPLAGAVICCMTWWLWSLVWPLRKAAFAPNEERGRNWLWSWSQGDRVAALGAAVLVLAAAVLLSIYSLPKVNLDQIVSGKGFPNLILIVLALVYACTIPVFARLSFPFSPLGRRWWIWGLGAFLLLIVLRTAMLWLWIPPGGEEFAFSRIGNFHSGLSPLVSLALLLAGVYAWVVFDIKRLRLIALQGMDWPLATATGAALRECRDMADGLGEVLGGSLRAWKLWAVVVLLLLLPQRRLHEGIQPIAEGAPYGWPFLGLVGLVFVLAAISFYRFFVVWRQLERILDRLCHTWLLRELRVSSKSLDWRPMKSFGLRMPTFKMSVLALKKLEIIERLGLLGSVEQPVPGDERGLVECLDGQLAVAFSAQREGDLKEEIAARSKVLAGLASCTAVLEDAHRTMTLDAKPVPEPLPESDPRSEELKAVEQFLAIRVVSYLRYVFAHLRNYLLNAMLCGLILLVGVSLYAFEPKQFLSFGIWIELLACTLITIWIFVQMDRNAALSAIGTTDAGQVTFDRTFFRNVFTYGAVPLISVVVTQFPIVGRVFSQWLAPLLRMVGAQ